MTLAEGIQSDIERVSKTISDLKTAIREPGFNQAPAIAQLLGQFYTGLESCLEKKLKLAGLAVPDKTDKFHRALLMEAIKGSFIPPACVDDVVDLLAFRHFVRHGYGAEFRIDEVKQKAASAEKTWNVLKPLWNASLDREREKMPDLNEDIAS